MNILSMLQINSLSFKHPDEQEYLFEDISFSLKGGEILCIEGQNGSGKTTLLKLISGFYKIDDYKGNIILKNNNKQVFIPTDLNHFLLPWYTFEQNISFFNTSGKHLYCKKSIDKGIALLALLSNFKSNSISDIKIRKVFKLSSGEKAYLGLICALLNEPFLLILDEIFSNIHNKNSERIISFLQNEFINEEKAIIFTSHYPELVKSFYTRKFKIQANENSQKNI